MEEFMNVLIADCDAVVRSRTAATLEKHGFNVCVALNGVQALDMLKNGRYDVLCVSLVLAGLDGFALLDAIAGAALLRYPFIIVQTSMDERMMERAYRGGADAVLRKPVQEAHLLSVLEQARKQPSRHSVLVSQRIFERACRQTASLGIPGHLKGFQYLSRAVSLCYADDRLLSRATSLLYPRVAADAGATSSGVEHAIRQAIETTWTRGSMEPLLTAFGNSIDPQRGKPTNIECIALLVERLRKENDLEE